MTIPGGTLLGPYEVEELIGAGGMGAVYRAVDSRLDRKIAIKILPSSFASNPQLLARFEREAKTISSLSHPNICVLHDVGKAELPASQVEPDSVSLSGDITVREREVPERPRPAGWPAGVPPAAAKRGELRDLASCVRRPFGLPRR